MTQINDTTSEVKNNYLYKDLSYQIVGICMEIHREYGYTHNERIYHKVLEEKLVTSNINFLSKPRIAIYSKDSGKEVGYYEPDLLIDSKIVLELKALPIAMKKNEVQLLEYLKNSQYELGYLLNFGQKSLYFKRIIYTNDNKSFMSKIKTKAM